MAFNPKELFPVPIRAQRDENGKVIIEGNTDEDTSYWDIPSSKIGFREGQSNSGYNYLTISIPHELTQYAGVSPLQVPDSFFGDQRYTFTRDKKGMPEFRQNSKIISEQEFFGVLQTAVAPLLGKVLPQNYIETLQEFVREQRAIADGKSKSTSNKSSIPIGVVAATDGNCSAFWRNRMAEPAIYCKDREGPQSSVGKQGLRYEHLLKHYDGIRHFSGVFRSSDFDNNKPLPSGYDSSLAGTNTQMLRALLSEAAAQTTAGIYTEALHLKGRHSNPIARSVGAKPNDSSAKLR